MIKFFSHTDYASQVTAINRSQAVIEFNLDGIIINANENFLKAMGYRLNEIVGKHHSIFVDPAYASSQEYKNFWKNLRQGKFDAGEYMRYGKNGKEVWIQATYNPIMNAYGKPFKVIKFATDITEQKAKNANYEGQINAIHRSQAVIEFDLEGMILDANQNFLNVMGYRIEEIQGKHHSMFVSKEYSQTDEYKDFWERLAHGQFDSRVFPRVRKDKSTVWIQASYNPILDAKGKPCKVVKYATDITQIIELTDKTSSGMQTVSQAVEEISASIQNISENMHRSESAAKDIIDQTSKSTISGEDLTNAMKNMEEIITTIKDIAEHVNLLALNATIEAARAGESGRGFAVVASEVKNLADQTKLAAEQVEMEIMTTQNVSNSVVSGIISIAGYAQKVGDYSSSVSKCLEEQNAIMGSLLTTAQSTMLDAQKMNNAVKHC